MEVLVESGDLLARDAERASKLLETGNRGVIDVMLGDNIEDCVLETDSPNLFVLTVGDATEADIRRLSLNGMQRVFEAAREKFDNVLVDTGPTPGSSEAALVTAANSDSPEDEAMRVWVRLHALRRAGQTTTPPGVGFRVRRHPA